MMNVNVTATVNKPNVVKVFMQHNFLFLCNNLWTMHNFPAVVKSIKPKHTVPKLKVTVSAKLMQAKIVVLGVYMWHKILNLNASVNVTVPKLKVNVKMKEQSTKLIGPKDICTGAVRSVNNLNGKVVSGTLSTQCSLFTIQMGCPVKRTSRKRMCMAVTITTPNSRNIISSINISITVAIPYKLNCSCTKT